jgi:hypothetical protein
MLALLAAAAGGMVFPFEGRVRAQAGGEIFYPNWMGRAILQTLYDIMGQNGLRATLDLAGLMKYDGNYPLNDLERAFDVAEFVAIQRSLQQVYGPRGGRALAVRGGRALFANGLSDFTEIAVGTVRDEPVETRLNVGIHAIANFFNAFTDQTATVTEESDQYRFRLEPFPFEDEAGCHVCYWIQGILQEGARDFSDGAEFDVTADDCMAVNTGVCRLTILKEPIG